MIYIYIYIYIFIYICTHCLFYFAKINTIKTELGLEISFQTKHLEYLSDFLSLTNFLRLEETVDWPKLLKFDKTCSKWSVQLEWIPGLESQQYSKLKQNNVDLRKSSNIPKLQNMILRQTWHTGHRLVQSYHQRVKETREGMTQVFLMMNLNRSLFSLNYPKPNVYKTYQI